MPFSEPHSCKNSEWDRRTTATHDVWDAMHLHAILTCAVNRTKEPKKTSHGRREKKGANWGKVSLSVSPSIGDPSEMGCNAGRKEGSTKVISVAAAAAMELISERRTEGPFSVSTTENVKIDSRRKAEGRKHTKSDRRETIYLEQSREIRSRGRTRRRWKVTVLPGDFPTGGDMREALDGGANKGRGQSA